MPLLSGSVIFAAILLAAAGAGTLVTGSRFPLALRSVLGLAVLAHALFVLGLLGWLRPAPILALYVLAICGVLRHPPSAIRHLPLFAFFAPLFLLALHPPLAFDETLYHLPFIRAAAESGRLQFLTDYRFPVFPQLHELLCVPPFLVAGDVATHLVSLAELAILSALVYEWGGALATALLLGSPIVLHLGTVLYVDTALALFVAAGFYCVDRGHDALAGFFLGSACSVKYLGGFFAAAALVIRRRMKYALWCLAAALPTTLWIFACTGDPLFPFVRDSLWRIPLAPVSLGTRIVRTLALLWNVTFARQHVNFQPPVTPLLVGMVIALIAIARRELRARVVAILCAAYVIVFAFLPQDTRYLLPLIPLICVAIANGWRMADGRWRNSVLAIRHLPSAIQFIAIAPGVLYIGYRLVVMGWPPMNDAQRDAELRARVPEYAAVVRAGDDRVYACGGEQLKYFARGSLIGDENGPFAYRRILAPDTATLAERLRAIGAQSFLVAKRACTPPRANGGMELVYEDASAQLWRVIASTRPRAPDSRGTSQPLP